VDLPEVIMVIHLRFCVFFEALCLRKAISDEVLKTSHGAWKKVDELGTGVCLKFCSSDSIAA
jgi:hypothetical protein